MHARYDKDGMYLSASEEAKALLGYEPGELVGTSAYTYFHPEDLAIIAAAHARVLGLPDSTTATYRRRRRDGSYVTVTSTSVISRDAVSGEVEIDEVTMRARLQQGQQSQGSLEQEFACLVERAPSMVAVLDVDRARILYANALLERTVGVEFGSLEGASFFELIHRESLARVVGFLSVLLHDPHSRTTLRCRLRRVDGRAVSVSMIVLDLTEDPAVKGLLVVAHQSAEAEASRALGGVSSRDADPPGGVVARSELHQWLAALLADPAEVSAGVALATIRLDDFDNIGEALGAAAASEVLRQASERVGTLLAEGPGDSDIAHLGIGRLAVVLRGVSHLDDARAFGERLRDVLATAFYLDEAEVFVSPRVVVVTTPVGATADGILAASHHELEQNGLGTRVAAFQATPRDVASARLRLRTELRHSIERDQLVLHYQPCYSLADHHMLGVEALVRWQHPTRGLLAPGEFIQLAEESDFIVPLGRWVLQAACRQLAAWSSTHPALSFVGVNVSAHQLLDARFTEAVADALVSTALPAARLCLEITETAVLDTDNRVTAALEQLVGMGVQIAIDDFGTGHANLSYLQRIPAHVVKIDRSFVLGLDNDDPTDVAIVAGTIAMAHALGRTVTAEGVETAKQLAALHDMGCDHAQGYFLSGPVPADQVHAAVLGARS